MTQKSVTKAEKILAQCPECSMVKVRFPNDKVERWQGCIAKFNHVPEETCYSCRNKEIVKEPNITINGITAFDHQDRSVKLFKEKNQILAHEMGLGKTLTSAFIGYGDKNLVVCPAKLKKSWVKELSLIGIESVQIVETGKDELEGKDWTIVSYEIASKIYDRLLEQDYQHLFGDESHYIKGKFRIFKNGKMSGIKRASAFVYLSQHIPHVILTTGTPIMNAPIELWNQLVAIDAQITKEMTRAEYSKRYCGGHLKQMGRYRFWWEGGANHIDELKERIKDDIDVLKKEEVLDLPEKLINRKVVELSKAEMKEYNNAWKHYLEAVKNNPELQEKDIENILEAQTLVEGQKLEQIASLAKVNQAIEDLQNLGPNDTVIIFTQWVETIEALNRGIEEMAKKQKKEMSEHVITYSTLKDEDGVEKFQEGKVQVFTANIVAGGTGLNLQENCNNIWIIDENWNPGINQQAEDRIYRIGQKHTSFITYYEAFNTIDEKKRDSNIRKQKVSKKLLSTPEGE